VTIRPVAEARSTLPGMPELVPASAGAASDAASALRAPAGRFAAIEVRDLEKTFRIPKRQVHTFKERALHPFRRAEYEQLRVLRGISFDVLQGEFFGIVGRNGSGKSTLLKCMAGIYRADAGRIAVAGRISPFIELGVGFNPDLTARDNVLINAVMMGLSPREARSRFDEIIAFAELEDFVDLKLKNYSSGMQVRLAFSVMVQSGADVLLIDEVLAVGDAAFQQRCLDQFHKMRAEGRTIVLVTHDMETVDRFCHRAMLITDGQIEMLGDPERVGRRYLERNFENFRTSQVEIVDRGEEGDRARAEIEDVWLENDSGMRVETAPHGGTLRLHALIDVHDHIREPIVDFWVDDEEDARVFATSTRPWEPAAPLEPGDRLHVTVNVENLLASGRYHIGCSLLSGSAALDIVVLVNRHRPFIVYAGDYVYGLVQLRHELHVDRDRS
jgi:ABC-type polysaccharide/polyol phosphate transport system ATPase subunit